MDKLENLKQSIYKILEKDITILKSNGKDEKFITLFKNCFLNTIDTTVTYDEDTFVITGDINAMWLRDSTCQILHYLKYINKSNEIKEFIKSLIEKQFSLILIDPYANAFNKEPLKSKWATDITLMNDYIWERKYELDSITYPIYLLNEYIRYTNDYSIFTDTIIKGINKCFETFKIEINHKELSKYTFLRHRKKGDYLINDGIGPDLKYTGMIASLFRPSDDPVEYPYNIPGNIFLSSTLKELYKYISIDSIREDILFITSSIDKGIKEYGIINGIYAYEVDGFGNYNLMDDANMPSLLSIPLLSKTSYDNDIYLKTRQFILSNNNPYYFSGEYGKGIGSPHTNEGYIWPISLSVEALTTLPKEDKLRILNMLENTHADTFYMHESFDTSNPVNYSRSWFSWANTMFSLVVMDLYNLEDID